MINLAIRVCGVMALISFIGHSVFAQDKKNPSELVGKWCYTSPVIGGNGNLSNTCLTLNGDGTYEFFLDDVGFAKGSDFFHDAGFQEFDKGTWSVEGNALSYVSSANGDGTFQFQKVNHPEIKRMPMIVVNGQSFASATPRDPW